MRFPWFNSPLRHPVFHVSTTQKQFLNRLTGFDQISFMLPSIPKLSNISPYMKPAKQLWTFMQKSGKINPKNFRTSPLVTESYDEFLDLIGNFS